MTKRVLIPAQIDALPSQHNRALQTLNQICPKKRISQVACPSFRIT